MKKETVSQTFYMIFRTCSDLKSFIIFISFSLNCQSDQSLSNHSHQKMHTGLQSSILLNDIQYCNDQLLRPQLMVPSQFPFTPSSFYQSNHVINCRLIVHIPVAVQHQSNYIIPNSQQKMRLRSQFLINNHWSTLQLDSDCTSLTH